MVLIIFIEAILVDLFVGQIVVKSNIQNHFYDVTNTSDSLARRSSRNEQHHRQFAANILNHANSEETETFQQRNATRSHDHCPHASHLDLMSPACWYMRQCCIGSVVFVPQQDNNRPTRRRHPIRR